MSIVYLDFETYWDREGYTLSKMSMEAYVRDPKFEALMLAIAVDDGPVQVIEGADNIANIIHAIPTGNKDVLVVAHNAKFDGFVLSHIYRKFIANPICTIAMARYVGASRLAGESLRALSEFYNFPKKTEGVLISDGKHQADFTPAEWAEFREYARMDVELLRMLFKALRPHCDDDVLQFIAMSTQMYIHPRLKVDQDKIRDYERRALQRYDDNRRRIQNRFNFRTEEEFLKAIRSPKMFPAMLESLGVEVPMKFSKNKTITARKKAKVELAKLAEFVKANQDSLLPEAIDELNKQADTWLHDLKHSQKTPATAKTDIEFLQLLEHPDEDVATLASVKLNVGSSLQLTRARTLIDISSRGSVPVPLEPYKALTSRYGVGGGEAKGDAINFQNLDSHSGDKTIKNTITAPDGHFILVGADSSQIEARMLAVLACQDDLVQGFARGEDVYCELAGAITGEDPKELYYYAKGEGAKLDAEKHKHADTARFYGKTGILSAGYGVGAQKYADYFLSKGNWLGPKGDREAHDREAKRHLMIYRKRNQAIVDFWAECGNVLRDLIAEGNGWFGGPDRNIFFYDGRHSVNGKRMPAIMLPDGYWVPYLNLRYFTADEGKKMGLDDATIADEERRGAMLYDMWQGKNLLRRFIHAAMCTNNICQGVSSSVLRWQILRYRGATNYPVVMNVHDFWMSVVPKSQGQVALECMMYWMRQTPPWFKAFIPLDCEGGMGTDYGSL